MMTSIKSNGQILNNARPSSHKSKIRDADEEQKLKSSNAAYYKSSYKARPREIDDRFDLEGWLAEIAGEES
jgi:hypothetical protein